jgi:hypothetical protein
MNGVGVASVSNCTQHNSFHSGCAVVERLLMVDNI